MKNYLSEYCKECKYEISKTKCDKCRQDYDNRLAKTTNSEFLIPKYYKENRINIPK